MASGRRVISRKPTEVALQLLELAGEQQGFLLRHRVELAGALHPLVLEHLVDPLGDRVEVGEHAAEPALVDVGHAALLGEAAHRVLGLLLGADEHQHAAPGDQVTNEAVGLVDTRQRLLEVDDVDAVALAEDEAAHLRVPTSGLVTEVHASFEQLAHRDDSHRGFSFCGCAAHRRPQATAVRWTDQ